jgi:6,7-dimethyl-8-ribityllumazine synthase
LDTSSPSEIAVPEFSGEPRGEGRRLVVVASRFNEGIVTRLAEGAVSALVGKGVAMTDVDVLWVPGAWELPVAVRRALASGRYDAAVAVGAIIRGDTPHFDVVVNECARGLMEASRDFDVPVTMGVLTTDDMAQAESRAGGEHGNKGEDAALVALEVLDLFDRALPAEFDGDEG